MAAIHHALILNLHQPAGNMWDLLQENPWEAKEILYALDRIPRSLWAFEDIGKVHLSVSGTLLETLANPDFQKAVYGTVDCGSLLWHLQNLSIFRVLGTGYYHPVLPLIPVNDRAHHLERWKGLAGHLFFRDQFQGFWPPEMGFSMELIPLLKKSGYRYVTVDSEHIEAVTPMSWSALRYQPHIARYQDDEIIVVVRDRDLSNAQESGMDIDWFEQEVRQRTQWCDFTPLVITATDGDNGGWFRNSDMSANFWGFYQELLNRSRSQKSEVTPCFIEQYLDQFGATGEVHINTGAWNTGWHDGRGFTQWTGSYAQKEVLSRINITSQELENTDNILSSTQGDRATMMQHLEEARWHLLRSETSCNIYWGEDWVSRAHADLDSCWSELNIVKTHLRSSGPDRTD
jgi:alpha-amylase/alpha-mannosidase (GH57 family)